MYSENLTSVVACFSFVPFVRKILNCAYPRGYENPFAFPYNQMLES